MRNQRPIPGHAHTGPDVRTLEQIQSVPRSDRLGWWRHISEYGDPQLTYGQSAALMQLVYDTAGVGAGVTPGADPDLIATIPAEPPASRRMTALTGAWETTGFNTSEDWYNGGAGFQNVYIRNKGDARYFSAVTHSGITSGTGEPDSPYLIDDFLSFNAAGNGDPQLEDGSLLLWDDPTADYHIRVTNAHLWTTDTSISNPSFRVNVPAGQSITFDTCKMYCDRNGADFIRVESGTVNLNVVLTTAAETDHVVMAGPNAVFNATNWHIDDTFGNLGGSFLSTRLASSGCSITLTKVSYLPVNVTVIKVICDLLTDLTLTINQCAFSTRSRADSGVGNGIVQFWSTGPCTEPMPLPKRFIDTEIFSNNSQMFAAPNTQPEFIYTNVEFKRCFFYHTLSENNRMIECGPSPTAITPPVDKWHISWCRFEKPHTGTNTAPGNEILYLIGVDGCVVEYCWAEAAPEDCYEMYLVRNNNTIRYCGVGNPAGTKGAHIQAAEMYLSYHDLPTSGNTMHDIWGHCGGEGALVTNVSNVKTWNILTKSNADIYGPVLTVIPQANVSIANRWLARPSPTGCENSGFCTQDSHSTGRDFGGVGAGTPTAWAEVGQNGELPPTGNTDTAERKPSLTPVLHPSGGVNMTDSEMLETDFNGSWVISQPGDPSFPPSIGGGSLTMLANGFHVIENTTVLGLEPTTQYRVTFGGPISTTGAGINIKLGGQSAGAYILNGETSVLVTSAFTNDGVLRLDSVERAFTVVGNITIIKEPAVIDMIQLSQYLLDQGWPVTGISPISFTVDGIQELKVDLKSCNFNGASGPLLVDLKNGLSVQGVICP